MNNILKDELLKLLGNTDYPETERNQLFRFLNGFCKEGELPSTFLQKTSTFDVPSPGKSFKVTRKNMAAFWEEVNECELNRGWEPINLSLTKNWFHVLPSGTLMENFASFKPSLYSVYSKEEEKQHSHEYRTHPMAINEAERCGIKKIYTPHEAFSVIKHAILSGQINEKQKIISVYYEIDRSHPYLYVMDVVRDASHKHLWITSEEVTYNMGHSNSTRIAFL